MAEGDVEARTPAEAEARTPRRLWVVVEESRARAAKIQEKIRHLSLSMGRADFTAGLSEEERAAKLAMAKEENRRNVRECLRLLQCKPDLSGVTEAERAAEAERLRQKELEEARRLQMKDEGNHRASRLEALVRLRIIDLDPKQNGRYHNRFSFFDEKTFDPDKESPIAPMRFTEAVYKSESDYRSRICEAVNMLSVKIACSDVGFPIHVYGTVIARDSIDQLCVYHFRRDGDHCQLINSEDESLILTGPKRGLTMLDDIYVETDLKIKDHPGQDRELSKGVFYIRGISRSFEKCTVETKSIATRLSTVDVTYAVIARAIEATIAVKVLHGVFYEKITAYTTSIKDSLLLYDSDEAAFTLTSNDFDFGAIRLMRSVVSVFLKDMLIVEVHTEDGKSRSILFTPRVNGGDEDQITVGATVMCEGGLVSNGSLTGLYRLAVRASPASPYPGSHPRFEG